MNTKTVARIETENRTFTVEKVLSRRPSGGRKAETNVYEHTDDGRSLLERGLDGSISDSETSISAAKDAVKFHTDSPILGVQEVS